MPQALGHAAPLKLQRMAGSGCPALATAALNCNLAPSSAFVAPGVTVTATSLEIVICAPADLELSAKLVAVMVRFAGDGRSRGAVNTPSTEIVPSEAFPPVMPLTAHETRVSVALLTVALNACELPSKVTALVGFTTTTIGAGGGATGGGAAEPPPHPASGRSLSRAKAAIAAASASWIRRYRCLLSLPRGTHGE